MQNEIFINPHPLPSPPPYKENYSPNMDSNAWPSSYYGRTRRIDLAKFYQNILKESNNNDDHQYNNSLSSGSSSSSEEEEEFEEEYDQSNQISQDCTTADNQNKAKKHKKVRFSKEPPTVFEYEAEYDDKPTSSILFDDGWPGRTKAAMKSTGFIDFKSKIEAKLGAINDPELISQLDTMVQEPPSYRGYYRDRKSPLVKKLNLRPIPNDDSIPSPTHSDYSPITPRDGLPLSSVEPSNSTTSTLTPGGSKWLNRTLSRIRNNSPRTKQ